MTSMKISLESLILLTQSLWTLWSLVALRWSLCVVTSAWSVLPTAASAQTPMGVADVTAVLTPCSAPACGAATVAVSTGALRTAAAVASVLGRQAVPDSGSR